MGFYQFKAKQTIPANIKETWEFISSPNNLKKITPDYMGFEVTSVLPDKMYEGLMISYKVKPLLGIPTTWVTEITRIKEYSYFVDEQRLGPYKIWHHEHFIKEVSNGVEMQDIVSYAPPLGILGAVMNKLLIRSKLEEIFSYREKKIIEIFNG